VTCARTRIRQTYVNEEDARIKRGAKRERSGGKQEATGGALLGGSLRFDG